MTLSHLDSRPMILAAAVLCCVTTSQRLLAADPGASPNVVYTATGVFASPQISGGDFAGLAGEPFSITVVANESLVPTSTGNGWARYTGLTMSATVSSSEQQPPLTFQNHHAQLELAVGNPGYDEILVSSPILPYDVGNWLRFRAEVQLPKGTLTGDRILPFTVPYTFSSSSVATFVLRCAGSGFPYCFTDPRLSTTLGFASGTLSTTVK